ncbi:hypothetical protein LGM69_25255 [Burkholderia multivorans]|nr:hypothetical protein [Burkholderia multivorans]
MRSKVALSDAERMRKSRAKLAPVRAALGVFIRKSLLDDSRARLASIRTTARDVLNENPTMTAKDRAALQTLAHAGLMHLAGAALELLARQHPDKQAELIRQYIVTTAKFEADALTAVVATTEPVEATEPATLDGLGAFIATGDTGAVA